MIEVYRDFIRSSKVLDDNKGQHYKTMQGKMQYLSNQTRLMIEGFKEGPGNFKIPDKKIITKITENKPFAVFFELWKVVDLKFDVQNYMKTFKAPVDVFSNEGYWEDDNWTLFSPVILNGGSRNVWDRAYRYDNDNLPDELSYEWWKNEGAETYDTMIRILISNNPLKYFNRI